MKKKTKKLVLAKETVRTLCDEDLIQAAGGTNYINCFCPVPTRSSY